MSSQVFARKYRPQNFEEVQGQETAVRILKNALEEKRFHHAYLFAGPRGTGKTTLARILAKAMNCEKGPTPTPCDTCQQCLEITKGSSMCVQEIDGASNTSVDDVRDIRDKIRYLPPGGRYKIYIIDEVHMLSTAAFNALLKTLEEPPPHAVFIFATTEIHKLPATVLSRLIRLDLKPLSRTTIVSQLKKIAQQENVLISDSALLYLAREASGGMRDALSLLDQVVSFGGGGGGKSIDDATVEEMLGASSLKFVLQILENILTANPAQALLKTQEALAAGIEPKRIANELLEYARHLLVVKTSQDPILFDLTSEEVAHLKTLSEKLSSSEIDYLFIILQKGIIELLRSSHPHLLLDVLVVRACHVSDLKPLETFQSSQTSSPTRTLSSQPTSTITTPPKTNTPLQAAPEMSWPAFLGFLRSKKPQFHAMISEGKLVSLTPSEVVLHFAPSSLNLSMLKDPDREMALKNFLKDYFQKPMSLVFETKARDTTPVANKTTQASISNSIIDDAIDIFGPETTKIPQKAS
ncbi:MAG: DNA polymerase III subunit gamma/tau [Deltaproteobacteria bacterium]|nr:MAG: DNA polymerase III subunit gamma/tau [Deltaproteobacteria bacterium]